jgi:toxin HigB-1
MAIETFAGKYLKTFFESGILPKRIGWRNFKGIVLRKLDMLDYATQLKDLRSPPGNRLETLRGKLRGLYSIRINDQWRIIFRWGPTGPTNVDVVDYHD